MGMILPLVMIMAVFWFLLIRPQQRKLKEHQDVISKISRGDTVVTNGGLIGRVAKVVDRKDGGTRSRCRRRSWRRRWRRSWRRCRCRRGRTATTRPVEFGASAVSTPTVEDNSIDRSRRRTEGNSTGSDDTVLYVIVKNNSRQRIHSSSGVDRHNRVEIAAGGRDRSATR